MTKSIILLCFITPFILSCGGNKKSESKEGENQLDERTEIRLRQYFIEGKRLYKTYCLNCHQAEGKGLASLYPPLAGSDYLLENLQRAACMIKEGGMEEITVNGTKYNQMMPPNPSLTSLEVAEILTYISNDWGNNKGLSAVKDVEKWLKKCDQN